MCVHWQYFASYFIEAFHRLLQTFVWWYRDRSTQVNKNNVDFSVGSVLGYLCVVVMSILLRKNVQKVKNWGSTQIGCGRLSGQKRDSPWRAGECPSPVSRPQASFWLGNVHFRNVFTRENRHYHNTKNPLKGPEQQKYSVRSRFGVTLCCGNVDSPS